MITVCLLYAHAQLILENKLVINFTPPNLFSVGSILQNSMQKVHGGSYWDIAWVDERLTNLVNLTGENNFMGSFAMVRIKTFPTGMPTCLFSFDQYSNGLPTYWHNVLRKIGKYRLQRAQHLLTEHQKGH